MSSTYAGANTFPATITVLDDGDAANAASVAPALEGLADRTAYLQTRTGSRRVVAAGGVSGQAADTGYTGTSYTFVSNSSVNLGTLAAGDIVIGTFTAEVSGNGDVVAMRAAVFDGASYQRASREFVVNNGDSDTSTFSIYYAVVTGGTGSIRLEVKTDAGLGSVDVSSDFTVQVMVLRSN
jgi:hypothetical protein